MGKLIVYGLFVGIAAGLLAFGWARAFGEPSVNEAIRFESAQDEAREAAAKAAGKEVEAEAPEIFSRTVQSGIGLLTGVVVVGAGLGCLFAVLFALAYGRIGNFGPGSTSVLLALLGLMAVYLVPALKYPANPPSVGEPDTIKYRTALYFLMMALSIGSMVGAWLLRRRLLPRHGTWNASLIALLGYLVVIGAAFVILPGINEVPETFPAVTLWNFRVASVGLQTVLWGSIGVMFGCIMEWTMKPTSVAVRSGVPTR